MNLFFQRSCFLSLIIICNIRIINAFDRVELIASPYINSPVIQKESVVYSVDFEFNKYPDDYVLYYDRYQKKMVIDFYRVTLSWADSVKSSSFSGEVSVKNVETAMTLSGQKGQILFSLQKGWNFEQGWHYQSEIISPNKLRVKLWIELHPAVKIKKNQDLSDSGIGY